MSSLSSYVHVSSIVCAFNNLSQTRVPRTSKIVSKEATKSVLLSLALLLVCLGVSHHLAGTGFLFMVGSMDLRFLAAVKLFLKVYHQFFFAEAPDISVLGWLELTCCIIAMNHCDRSHDIPLKSHHIPPQIKAHHFMVWFQVFLQFESVASLYLQMLCGIASCMW